MIGINKGFDYSKPPASPTPPSKNEAYIGTYTNSFYGAIKVIAQEFYANYQLRVRTP